MGCLLGATGGASLVSPSSSNFKTQDEHLSKQTEEILPDCADIQAYKTSALSALSLLLIFKLYEGEGEEEKEGHAVKKGKEEARNKE